MAERESRQTEDEGTRRRQTVRQSPSKQLEARDPDSETAVDVASPESPGVLHDGRFSHPANIGQKARVVSQLQQSHGNAYVQRLLASRAVQAKLTINPPDDQYEREADRVAEAVVPTADLGIQRQEEEEEEELQTKPAGGTPQLAVQRQEEEEEEELQAKLASGTPQLGVQRQEEEEEEEVYTKPAGRRQPVASADLEARVQAERGRGQPLDDSARGSLEPALGVDMSDVRIHADAEADEMSRQLNAKAFTTGRDVFFRSGDYQPGTSEGDKLLAHEMTHVAQQSEGAAAPAARGMARPTSTRAVGKAPAAASDGRGTSVARQAEAEMKIARQPEEVTAEAATPPPATPAPPVGEKKDAARLAAVRAMWKIAVEDQVKEASTILSTKGAGKEQAREAYDKLSRARGVLDSIKPAYEGHEPVHGLLYAFGIQIAKLIGLLWPHLHGKALPVNTIGGIADPEGENLSKLVEAIRAGL